MGYVIVPSSTTPPDLAEEAFAYLEEKIPGWLPSPGNLEAWLIEALSQLASELAVLAGSVPDIIFAYFGATILGLPPFEATSAAASTSWTMIDALGYTVHAGTLVAITPPASTDSFTYQVVADFTVAAGASEAAGIQLVALEPGVASSGITGTCAVLDPLDFVQTVLLDAPTEGGVDAETAEAYLARLSDLLTLLAPRPILPQDFAIMAQRTVPAVARATALDLYNAETEETDVPRCVTVVVVGADGEPCSAETKAEVDAILQAQREVNFLVFVADPSYSTIDVSFAATSYYAYDPAEVAGRVEANIAAYLSPAGWGLPPFGDTSARSWISDDTVRYLEVAQVINQTDGVHYITSLTLGFHGSSLGAVDVVLPGAVALPQPGTITGTCTAET